MRKITLISFAATMALAASASGEVRVNVNVGIPAPHVVVSGPPRVVFDSPPVFITPPGLGFYVGVDMPYDMVLISGNYYFHQGNSWYRSRNYNGPWVGVRHEQLPAAIRRHKMEYIREQRDREFRVYHEQRDHYRGRHFRPDRERKEEWKEHRKEERRRDKEEWREERRDDRRDDMLDRRQHRRD